MPGLGSGEGELSQFWQCKDFLLPNPPVCQDWGVGSGGQANFVNSRILEASVPDVAP